MSSSESIIRDPAAGRNQSGLRDENARIVLSYLRRHGGMAGAEIARRSGLSAQTVSNILRALELQGLLSRGESQKGKVGKPSIPMKLNPSAVFSLGLNIGRRSAELVLVDFTGHQIASRTIPYAFPEVAVVFDFIEAGLEEILEVVPEARDRTVGIGVARPNKIWHWLEQVNAPERSMRSWKEIDLRDTLASVTGLDAYIENDATSACVAEHLLGRGGEFADFAYIFMGAFVGGGIVLNGKVVWGRSGNSGALGTLPVPDEDGGVTQLLNVASLYGLEAELQASGLAAARLRETETDWSEFEDQIAPWIDKTGHCLSVAAAAIVSVVEVEAIIIDGAMPATVRDRLTAATNEHFRDRDLTGIERPLLASGSVGWRARSIGAALLPIHSRYFLA